ncbi:aminopeptidase P N-terminal domain-containing protein [Thalassotalea profundi]|uniref:Xaa-Pro aminopeptidase n=1 Tax=Thalassotalea profundi TaxID=2036687 RepID=A0ABQ3IKK4_9GAMM|nr:aminopeptidase P N-terminal domain-containing protein [Thalassotalea profundi]GHE86635.1 Xaa-Pro aminopeptidase [Thalassotalea profundi]
MIYQQRRAWLCQQLDSDSVVIVVGNTAKTRSKNINYHFRCDNDLYYLTGFTEPNAVAVIRPGHEQSYILFTRPNDASAETSFGKRAGLAGAIEFYQADTAYAINELDQTLPELLETRSKIYYLDEQGIYQDSIFKWINTQRKNTAFDVIKAYRQLLPLQPILHNARVIKSTEEITLIKHAVKASVSGHKAMMRSTKPGMNELQLSAIFDREIAEFGCREVSYPTIVASGNNGCCLHYEDNNSELKSGELVLVDAGAEYQKYCSDITRTWPINGKFTKEQALLYQLVLNALDAAIAIVRPGLPWCDIYNTAMRVLAQGLIDLELLSGEIDQVMNDESYRQFTVHKTGHWLGMDVHDVGSYHDKSNQWLTLKEAMVFTIEPGIYIPESCQQVDQKWRGIAIRVEDDIMVTKSGHQNLSAEIPRTIEDIERYMTSR